MNIALKKADFLYRAYLNNSEYFLHFDNSALSHYIFMKKMFQ